MYGEAFGETFAEVASGGVDAPDTDRRDLRVPFDRKDEAKEMGARWNPDTKRWFAEGTAAWHTCAAFHPPEGELTAPAAVGDAATGEKFLLDCPFAEKEEAKQLGARWDPDAKCWYGRGEVMRELCARWRPGAAAKATIGGGSGVPVGALWLHVDDSSENAAVKALGAQFDRVSRRWYVPPDHGSDRSQFERWRADTGLKRWISADFPSGSLHGPDGDSGELWGPRYKRAKRA